jgi:hypothetical protein
LTNSGKIATALVALLFGLEVSIAGVGASDRPPTQASTVCHEVGDFDSQLNRIVVNEPAPDREAMDHYVALLQSQVGEATQGVLSEDVQAFVHAYEHSVSPRYMPIFAKLFAYCAQMDLRSVAGDNSVLK